MRLKYKHGIKVETLLRGLWYGQQKINNWLIIIQLLRHFMFRNDIILGIHSRFWFWFLLFIENLHVDRQPGNSCVIYLLFTNVIYARLRTFNFDLYGKISWNNMAIEYHLKWPRRSLRKWNISKRKVKWPTQQEA